MTAVYALRSEQVEDESSEAQYQFFMVLHCSIVDRLRFVEYQWRRDSWTSRSRRIPSTGSGHEV